MIAPQIEQLRRAPPAELLQLRAKVANLRELLVHAEQVRWGVAGILGMLDEGRAGAQYSASGVPNLPHVPRMRAEA